MDALPSLVGQPRASHGRSHHLHPRAVGQAQRVHPRDSRVQIDNNHNLVENAMLTPSHAGKSVRAAPRR